MPSNLRLSLDSAQARSRKAANSSSKKTRDNFLNIVSRESLVDKEIPMKENDIAAADEAINALVSSTSSPKKKMRLSVIQAPDISAQREGDLSQNGVNMNHKTMLPSDIEVESASGPVSCSGRRTLKAQEKQLKVMKVPSGKQCLQISDAENLPSPDKS